MTTIERDNNVVESIERGFIERAEALQRVYLEPPGSGSLYSALHSSGQADALDLISISRSYNTKNISSSEYLSDIDKLLPSELRDIIIAYYYSGMSANASVNLLANDFLSAQQRSVIAQTLVVWGKTKDQLIVDTVRTGIENILESICNISKESPSFADPILQVAYTKKRTSDKSELSSISSFNSALATCKESYVHLLGPDIFELMRKATEPDFVFSAPLLAQFEAIADDWKILSLFRECLALRKFRSHPNDASIADLIKNNTISKSILIGSIGHLEKVKDSYDECDGRLLTERVLDAVNHDDGVVLWVDWDAVYDCNATAPRSISLRDAALHLLMGQRQVQDSYPLIALAEGDGAFASSLRATVRERRIKDLGALTDAMTELSGRCRHLVAEAILQHDNALELSGLIGYDPPWAKRLIQAKTLSFDARATAFRHDAATAFQSANIITKDFAREIKSDAIMSLRVAYLRGRQQNGLVHLRLEKISNEVEGLYREPVRIVRNFINTSSVVDTRVYKAGVVATLSNMVTEYVLLSGPDALKTTVSDALRHGQLRNRFMQAFDEALLSTSLSVKDPHAFYSEIEDPAHPQHWLLSARNRIRITIRKFNEEHLSVDLDSPLYRNVFELTEKFLALVLSRPEGRPVEIWRSDVQAVFTRFLSDARREFQRVFTELGADLGSGPIKGFRRAA